MPDSTQTPPNPPAAGAALPPPVIVLIIMAAGFAAHLIYPLSLPRDQGAAGIALASSLAAMLLLTGAFRAARAATTSLNPWRRTKVLLTGGVFGMSRNPVYLAFLCAQAALAWWLGYGWWLVLLPVSWFALDRVQIRREERYLTETFGKAYTDYQRKVGRWL